MKLVLPILILAVNLIFSVNGSADDTDIYRSLNDVEGGGGNPQVMIIFDTSNSMSTIVSHNASRMTIAKRVITKLVNDNPEVDFGLSIFNYNGQEPNGGRVIQALPGSEGLAGSREERRRKLVETINELDARTSTPLCETFYEIFRYFNGGQAWHGRDDRAKGRECNLWYCQAYLVDSNPEFTENAFSGGNRYRSPLRPCEPIYIIYMTDGEPQWDTAANEDIKSLTGKEGECRRYKDANGNFGGVENCLPELSRYMNKMGTFDRKDSSGMAVEQGPVTTYTIGFNTDQKLLIDTASPLNIDSENCPEGQKHSTRFYGDKACVGYFTADGAEQLQGAFQTAVDDILSRSTTFSAPAVSAAFTNNTQSFDRLYLPRFLPKNAPRWSGNIKRLQFVSQQSWRDVDGDEAFNDATGDIRDTAHTWWSDTLGLREADGSGVEVGGAGGLLKARIRPSLSNGFSDGRKVVTDFGNHLVDFTPLSAWMVAPANWGREKDASESELASLVAWARGWDVDDENGDGRTLESRPWVMGDVLHSDPIALNYGGDSQGQEKLYLTFGTNAGFLHFIDGDSGEEAWAFTPQSLGTLHQVLRENQEVAEDGDGALKHPYGIDGPPAYVRIDNDGDGKITTSNGDRMVLAFGLRRGGRHYYGLDVTDPQSPSLAWHITNRGNFSELGQSWAAPIPTRVPGHGNPVFVISGGYDEARDDPARDANVPDSMGRAVYIVDALDGSLVYRATPATPNHFVGRQAFEHALPGAAEVVDIDSDGIAERVYLADVGGNLWRLDLDSETASDWQVRKIAELGGEAADNRRFFNSVDFVTISVGSAQQELLMIGSGDRANPKSGGAGSGTTSARDAIFAVKDPVSSAGSGSANIQVVELTDLVDATDSAFCDRDTDVTGITCSSAWADSQGWVIYPDDAYSLPLPGAKVLAESVTVNGIAFFSIYVPEEPESICVPVIGRSYLFGLDIRTAYQARVVKDTDAEFAKGERAVEAGAYLLNRPALLRNGSELYMQGIGSANLTRLLEGKEGANGFDTPPIIKRSYWYEKPESTL
ncbi:hypothetical protein F0A16_16680 [Salinicola corii]|uniref:PilY1 beta-propeller domain-containing protein n=1 Tax=Salinicola corii TaxID=2606937 RepID=A0A640W9U3_9GAMM|nr:PilC/PilY family type IV pilus protein [Salinicola corii]KAA0016707.1 hypothetical protein F0A16_16680 [Salinicola corii]